MTRYHAHAPLILRERDRMTTTYTARRDIPPLWFGRPPGRLRQLIEWLRAWGAGE